MRTLASWASALLVLCLGWPAAAETPKPTDGSARSASDWLAAATRKDEDASAPFGIGEFDRSEPISIRADELEAREDDGVRTLSFRRNVELRQGALLLRARQLEARYPVGARQPDRLQARGDVRIREGARRAECDEAFYERASQRIVCRGDQAMLWDGEDRLAGSEVTFDLAGRRVLVDGGTAVEIHRPLVEAEEPGAEPLDEDDPRTLLRSGEGPVTIRADALEASEERGQRRIRFLGGVEVRRGDLTLRAGELDAFYPPESTEPDQLVARESVVIAQGEREANCARAVYLPVAHHVVCEGDAELRDGEDFVQGDRISFDFTAKRVDVVGSARLRMNPQKRDGGRR